MNRFTLIVLVSCCFFSAPSELKASPRENAFGAGAVSPALAGAGMAFVTNSAATYLNPANLSRCEKSNVELGFKQISTHLSVTPDGGTLNNIHQIGNLTVAEIGACFAPVNGLGIGLLATTNALEPLTIGLTTPTDGVYFARFDSSLRAPTIMASVGYAFVPQLSLGLGVSVAMHTTIRQDVYAPLSKSGKPFSTDLGATVSPRAAIVAGLQVQPWDFLGFGATFRSENFGQLDINAVTQASVLALDIPAIKVDMTGYLDYAPRQFGIGFVFKPFEIVTLATDLSYAAWSLNPGPFLKVTANPSSAVSSAIELPIVEEFGFNDVLIPKAGLEVMLRKVFAVRVGYAYHPAVVGHPTRLKSNIIDGDTHTASMGGGYRTQNESFGFHADMFVAAHVMPDNEVHKNTTNGYSFGGIVVSAGLTTGIEF